jgi:hypothetical protein
MAALRGVSSDRWEIARFAGNDDKREPKNDVERTQGGQVLHIGWFSTGRDKAARQLLQTVQDSIRSGDINGEISFVFSNREPGESKESDTFFELVQSYNGGAVMHVVTLNHPTVRRLVRGGSCPVRLTWPAQSHFPVSRKIHTKAITAIMDTTMMVIKPALSSPPDASPAA